MNEPADWNGGLTGILWNRGKQLVGWRQNCHSQGPWHTLQGWTARNFREFNKEKCYVQHLGQNNLEHQHGQGTSWSSSSSTDNYLVGLVEMLNMSQQCLVHTELCWEERQPFRRGVYSPLHSTHEAMSRACVQFCTHPEMSEDCSESSGETTNKVRGMKHMACEESLRKMILFSLGKRRLRQDLVTVSPHLKEEGS